VPVQPAPFLLVELIQRLCRRKARVVCHDASVDEVAVDVQELRLLDQHDWHPEDGYLARHRAAGAGERLRFSIPERLAASSPQRLPSVGEGSIRGGKSIFGIADVRRPSFQ